MSLNAVSTFSGSDQLILFCFSLSSEVLVKNYKNKDVITKQSARNLYEFLEDNFKNNRSFHSRVEDRVDFSKNQKLKANFEFLDAKNISITNISVGIKRYVSEKDISWNNHEFNNGIKVYTARFTYSKLPDNKNKTRLNKLKGFLIIDEELNGTVRLANENSDRVFSFNFANPSAIKATVNKQTKAIDTKSACYTELLSINRNCIEDPIFVILPPDDMPPLNSNSFKVLFYKDNDMSNSFASGMVAEGISLLRTVMQNSGLGAPNIETIIKSPVAPMCGANSNTCNKPYDEHLRDMETTGSKTVINQHRFDLSADLVIYLRLNSTPDHTGMVLGKNVPLSGGTDKAEFAYGVASEAGAIAHEIGHLLGAGHSKHNEVPGFYNSKAYIFYFRNKFYNVNSYFHTFMAYPTVCNELRLEDPDGGSSCEELEYFSDDERTTKYYYGSDPNYYLAILAHGDSSADNTFKIRQVLPYIKNYHQTLSGKSEPDAKITISSWGSGINTKYCVTAKDSSDPNGDLFGYVDWQVKKYSGEREQDYNSVKELPLAEDYCFTPKEYGDYRFVLAVRDDKGHGDVARESFSITIPKPTVTIDSTLEVLHTVSWDNLRAKDSKLSYTLVQKSEDGNTDVFSNLSDYKKSFWELFPGDYSYRVKACKYWINKTICSDYSTWVSVDVTSCYGYSDVKVVGYNGKNGELKKTSLSQNDCVFSGSVNLLESQQNTEFWIEASHKDGLKTWGYVSGDESNGIVGLTTNKIKPPKDVYGKMKWTINLTNALNNKGTYNINCDDCIGADADLLCESIKSVYLFGQLTKVSYGNLGPDEVAACKYQLSTCRMTKLSNALIDRGLGDEKYHDPTNSGFLSKGTIAIAAPNSGLGCFDISVIGKDMVDGSSVLKYSVKKIN